MKEKPQIDPAAYLPLITQGISYPPQFYYPGYPQQSLQLPPIIKNIQINTDGPTANHQRVSVIHEDALPSRPFVPSSTTLGERLSIYQFIRSSIFNNSDGQDISLDGGKSSTSFEGSEHSLLSFVKFGELNPYNTYKLSPNPYMGLPDGFLIYRTCYPIRHQEQSGSTMCAKDSTAVNVRMYKLLEGSFLVNRLNPKLFSKYDEWRELAFYEYIREYIIRKKVCPHFSTLFGYFISEKCGIDFDQINMIKYNKTSPNEPAYIVKNSTTSNNVGPQETGVVSYAENPGVKSYVDDTLKALSALPTYDPTNKNNLTNKKIKYVNTENKIMEVNPNAYLGKALVMLTESPTYSLLAWATKTYQNKGTVKEMINRGVHTENEWMNVLFQIMVGLYVMQIHKMFIRNFSVDNNVMIKDLTLRGPITSYWKYRINEMDFYIPNLGYLIMIDSNYKDVMNEGPSLTFGKKTVMTNTNKVDGKFLNDDCTLTDEEINNNVFEMFKTAFDVNGFDREFEKAGGCKPPSEVMAILSEITSDASSDTDKSIKKYIVKYMKQYLNNRTGTYLKEVEIANIRREDTREFKKGQLVVYEDGFKSFKFVIFLELTSPENALILSKDEGGDFIEESVHVSSLMNYSRAEPIAQSYKQNEANLTEDDLLETYIIKE